ncbi:hypothetical protein STENM327S_01287 [Streptomyces tendae]
MQGAEQAAGQGAGHRRGAVVVDGEPQPVPYVLADQGAVHGGGHALRRPRADQLGHPDRAGQSLPYRAQRVLQGVGHGLVPGPGDEQRQGPLHGGVQALAACQPVHDHGVRARRQTPVGWPWVCAAHSTASWATSCGSQPTRSPRAPSGRRPRARAHRGSWATRGCPSSRRRGRAAARAARPGGRTATPRGPASRRPCAAGRAPSRAGWRPSAGRPGAGRSAGARRRCPAGPGRGSARPRRTG